MADLVLIRYGELALKSPPVRREFERQLRRNILDQFVASGIAGRLRADHGHMYADVDDATAGIRALRRVFGVTSLSQVWEIPTERAAIEARLLALADAPLVDGRSFAVRARRTGTHPFTSQELARDLGGAVLDRFADRHLHVDLERPDVELFVEARGPRTYLSLARSTGPGGLPLGVAGSLAAIVDGPRGALGAFLMMKRGCRCALVVPPSGRDLVEGTLARFDPHARVRPAEDGEEARIAGLQAAAEEVHADGVVLPIGVDEYPAERARWGDRVLFSPTVGLTDAEVSERWRKIEDLAG